MKFMMHSGKVIYILIVIIVLLLLLLLFFVWQNNSIAITSISYKNEKIPDEFNGYTIVHISDLHNKKFGKDGKQLIDKIKEASPDIIVITGDLVDRRKLDMDAAIGFIIEALNIAPVYYVSGNHETLSDKYEDIKGRLLFMGVYVLDNDSIKITKNEESITLIGLRDPAFRTLEGKAATNISKLEKNLKNLYDDKSFTILLSHRPELFDIYVGNNIDLVFTGHAHGGQIRLPFIGGLIAPNQGIFPKYTTADYTEDDTTMIVSRGLGNSEFPLRVFNRPEIVKVTLGN